jgi:C_GCAxxG_C_C family probable redox protein
MDRQKRARNFFHTGANCAQSVVAAFAPDFGMDAETAFAVARGFGSGMATGEVCGALSGAVMVIGLSTGLDVENGPAKQEAYRLVKEFVRQFEARFGSTCCRILIGCDVSDPQTAQYAREKGLFVSVCTPLVTGAVAMLEDLLCEQGTLRSS